MKEKVISVLVLFTSTGTLICCALPAAIAAIAGGAAVTSLVSTVPFLVTISQYKELIFLMAGILITFSGILTFSPKGRVACSVTGGRGCEVAGKFQRVMFWLSVAIYALGAFMAYGYIHIVDLFQAS